jgi:starch-binding outer membrane protein, SusD/RagB family
MLNYKSTGMSIKISQFKVYINVVILPCIVIQAVFFVSCSDFLDVGVPKSKIKSATVFNDETTATAAVLGMYSNLFKADNFASGSDRSVSMLAGLSADELVNYPKVDLLSVAFQNNSIKPDNGYVLGLWASLYKSIYQANVIIEGVEGSDGLSDGFRTNLVGEALFIRAFCNFYLVNLFGEVPLVISSDYLQNEDIGKSEVQTIYSKIIEDLKKAEKLLPSDYTTASGERVRVNRYSAIALISRVYLYLKDWSSAEVAASEVINRTDLYSLCDEVPNIFLKNSSEAIWQIRPTYLGDNGATNEADFFSIENVFNYNILREDFISEMDPSDLRVMNWIDTLIMDPDTLFFPSKYKQYQRSLPMTEYSMVFRLAELYLIRAEARVMLGRVLGDDGAEGDVNIIRLRAGLSKTTSITESQMLSEIADERRIEFLAEWGHRWFDLKRSPIGVDVLKTLKIDFSLNDFLYPLPSSEIVKNSSLGDQNPGY